MIKRAGQWKRWREAYRGGGVEAAADARGPEGEEANGKGVGRDG